MFSHAVEALFTSVMVSNTAVKQTSQAYFSLSSQTLQLYMQIFNLEVRITDLA